VSVVSTFVMLPGAGSDSWYWHLVTPGLEAAGHDVIAIDLPYADDACGLPEYAAVAIESIGPRTDLALVAQSIAGFVAPMIAATVAVDLIALVAPMVPAPGESPGEWWDNTGQPEAARRYAIEDGRDPDKPFDPVEMFLHDVDPPLAAESANHVVEPSSTPFGQPWPLDRWPDVPTRCVIGRRDRLFPLEFQRRIVHERLGITADEIDSGHLPALSRPADLTRLLLHYHDDNTQLASREP
jgi:pimeloyl-ACP methyl ester carboxylesterase